MELTLALELPLDNLLAQTDEQTALAALAESTLLEF